MGDLRHIRGCLMDALEYLEGAGMKMADKTNPKLPHCKLGKHERARHDPPPSPQPASDELRRLRAQGHSPHVPRNEPHRPGVSADDFWRALFSRRAKR